MPCAPTGRDLAFCVPGESYLAVIDALYEVREQISWSYADRRAVRRSWPKLTAS